MLLINIPEAEHFDESSSTLFTAPGATLMLEHSLASLSKWESIWEKPFLNGETKTTPETRSYISCMNLAPVPSDDVYKRLSDADVNTISDYIGSKQTATWFRPEPNARRSTETITAEIIYYWMIAHSIPLEAQYWHLEKLLTLIKVSNEKNKPATKSTMSRADQASSRRALNKQRQAQLGTKG